MNRILILIFALLLYSCGEKPEIIFTNGKIYTLDEKNSVVEAIAVNHGKIIDMGTTNDIMDKYSSDNVIDLKGSPVLPGFTDSEGSIIEFSKNLNFINLSYAKSIDEIKSLVSDKVSNSYEGDWIGGYGWNELNLSEQDLLNMNKSVLDNIAPNNPVYLVNLSFNAVWVNSRLLRLLNIDKNTPSPPGGEIEKFPDGELTGVLYDSAVNLVKNNIPTLMRTEMKSQVEKGVREIIKYGITEVHDRTLGNEGIEIFRELIEGNRFPLKVYAIISGEDSSFVNSFFQKGPEINFNDKLTIKAVSIDYDGLFELQNSSMIDDFNEDPKRAAPYITEDQFKDIYSKSIDKNFQLCVKTVGDKAVSTVLSLIETVNKQKNASDKRTILEYCEFINPKDLVKISELKIIPSVRPDVCMNDIQIAPQMIKPENLNKLGLWNSLIKSGGMITTGSDFPFHQINPFLQIYYLVTRQNLDSSSVQIPNPDQKISLLDAVKSYTVWPAYASFQEKEKGTIEKGKFADMIVLSEDIFKADLKNIPNIKVLMTIINGRVVYNNKIIPENF